MAKHVWAKLADRKLHIAFIESASAGYLACQCSKSAYSGDILQGSIVCYDLSVKRNLMRISDRFMQKHSPESKKMTEKLAQQGKKLFDAEVIVACTGLLKPGGSETSSKPVGTFFYAIHYQNLVYSYRTVCNGPPNKKLKTLYRRMLKSLDQIIDA